MSSGSNLKLDSSHASDPENTHYFIRIGVDHNQSSLLEIQGLADSRVSIESVTDNGAGHAGITDDGFLQGGLINAEYADFIALGDDTFPAVQASPTASSTLSLSHVTFDGGGRLETYYGIGEDANFALQNVTFRNTLDDVSVALASGYALSTGTRAIVESVFDKAVQMYPGRGLTLAENVFGGAFEVTEGEWAAFDHNLVVLDGYSRNLPGDTSNNYWLVKNHDYNPNFVQIGTYAQNVTIDGEIFEADGDAEEGDCVYIGEAPSAVNLTIKNCLVLPSTEGESSGSLFSAFGNSNVTLNVEHNTYMAGTQGAVVGFSYAGHAGMLSSFKSNLAWDNTARGFKLFDIGSDDTVTGLVTAANADYNGGYNLLTGSNLKGYDALEFSSGSPGAHDVTGDPDFVDPTRNISSWDDSLGGEGSSDNAIAELSKRNDPSGYNEDYNIEDLISYVRGGFVPQNSAYEGTAHDSGDIGAVPVP
jgi:hypothetical protein